MRVVWAAANDTNGASECRTENSQQSPLCPPSSWWSSWWRCSSSWHPAYRRGSRHRIKKASASGAMGFVCKRHAGRSGQGRRCPRMQPYLLLAVRGVMSELVSVSLGLISQLRRKSAGPSSSSGCFSSPSELIFGVDTGSVECLRGNTIL